MQFIDGWNNHPLSTERNLTPNQLWIFGLHQISGTDSTIDRYLWEPDSFEEAYYYGIDPDGPITTCEHAPRVDVQKIESQLWIHKSV